MTQELRSLYEITGDIKDINTVLVQRDRLEKAEKDAERCKRFIDAMCEETFDTWTNGYRMQQVAMNIQHAMNITAAMEASK